MSRETRKNLVKFGPLVKKPKKKLTMEERQPIPKYGRGILSSEQPTAMFRRQKKKTYVKGTMEGKQVNTTGGMFKAMANTEEAKQAVKMDTSVYKPTDITKSPYGDADLAGKGRRGTRKGNIGKVQQITEDTKYGGMQTDKKSKLKKPKTSDKTSRKHASQTQMNAARKSMRLGSYNWTK
jgi:preprotein translocase subunit YajC